MICSGYTAGRLVPVSGDEYLKIKVCDNASKLRISTSIDRSWKVNLTTFKGVAVVSPRVLYFLLVKAAQHVQT